MLEDECKRCCCVGVGVEHRKKHITYIICTGTMAYEFIYSIFALYGNACETHVLHILFNTIHNSHTQHTPS